MRNLATDLDVTFCWPQKTFKKMVQCGSGFITLSKQFLFALWTLFWEYLQK